MRNGKVGKEKLAAQRWCLLHLGSIAIASAFVHKVPIIQTQQFPRLRYDNSQDCSALTQSSRNHLTIFRSVMKTDENIDCNAEFDILLEEPSTFARAVQYLKSHPNELEISRDRFGRIFDAIEKRTTDAEINGEASNQQQQQPAISESKKEMTEMYSLMKEQGHLRLFGSITKENMPASGSHTVRPSMLETITSLSMSSLTPQPSNTMALAGAVAALAEVGASEFLGWNLNFVFFATIGAALFDQLFVNGAISDTAARILQPEAQPKITRHEAGHFLCCYILGCPVEGYVLSSWGALQDPRFRGRGTSAATAFFDPNLSSQIETSKISRSSIDRYSIIVMAGIAAEAMMYGQADGGAGDESALIGFLSNLNGGSSSSAPAWNDLTIRNQARWGALQSVLILREYKECYDALVDALEKNASLGECIYAIENAAREYNKQPLRIPLGYISEEGGNEIWTKVIPNRSSAVTSMESNKVHATDTVDKKESIDTEASLETLQSYKETLKNKLKDIDEKLEGF